ncbi:glycoside hydrolase family 38 N-terminal domain-containing protein [Seonamhaeicola aphaedonensis]|uniref:Alpha-mannosidase n=1 Tax=Seonamhaeicola aphaedonensis TaxID=1461338 RepID=A0A3D9HDE1_9FLAO|nr:glycosyl hydrolase-related protein [Seonamhaeicola aphaedonensis]RED47497.1 alpha-mannosidase [Seonamhaeicola aphaedonensis]
MRFIFIIFLSLTFSVNANHFDNNPSLSFHEGNSNSHIQELNTNYKLYNICKNDFEGYYKPLSGRHFSAYGCIQEGLYNSLFTRSNSNDEPIAFLTSKVPVDYNKETATFFMISNLSLKHRDHFNVRVNNEFLLTFKANKNGVLEVTNNVPKSQIEFVLVKRDGNGDGYGAMRLTVPTSFLKKGESAKISIEGHRKNDNAWAMIFMANDAVEHITKLVLNGASFDIKEKDGLLFVDAPTHFAGKKVYLTSDGIKSQPKIFEAIGELAKTSFKIPAPKTSFSITYGDESMTIEFENNDGTITTTDIQGSYLLHHNCNYKNEWRATLTKLYRPEFYDTYDNFFDKTYENGQVSIMNSSHQDIAWVDRPEVCIILRDTMLLTPVIRDAFIRDDYGFDIEDGLMLREYLNRNPDSKDKITTLLNKQLISVGASYNCPYEDMYDAEDQVRQLYLGKKWVKKTFGGYDSKVYWNVDVPGKTLQLPQILKKAGVDYMVISRHARGMFHWASPDGSSVFAYSPGHYGVDETMLRRGELKDKIKYGAEQIMFWEQNFDTDKVQTPLLSSQDMLPAIDYSDYIEAWNSFESIKNEDGETQDIHLPPMELMTVDEYMPLAEKHATKVDTIIGERPNVWVYIHGAGHHEALTASREGSKLLPGAEKFLAIANKLDPAKMPYPFEEFDEAWQAKIYPDHGWGGHDGNVTDNLFKANLVKSRVMGQKLLDRGIHFIASKIKKNEKLGMPLVLFNSLSWDRMDPVTTKVQFIKGSFFNVGVVTSKKEQIHSQISNPEYYSDGSLKSADITFIATVPSIGYATYYLQNNVNSKGTTKITSNTNQYENSFYKIDFEDGGIAQVYDKELKKNLFKNDTFKAGEIFTMESVGTGAGEFSDVQQPTMKDFDHVSKHNPKWEVLENGPIYTKYRVEQQIKHAIVRQDITLYHNLKRIYFNNSLRNWDGKLYREFRTAFPINMDNPEVAHEVPFGKVRVGIDEIETAGDFYTPLCKNVRPRGIIDWISATDDDMTVTLSSSVSTADWKDPTGQTDTTILQNLLLASRRSCHWEGNEYSQGGDHFYHNVLTSTIKGSVEGQKVAKQENEPIQVVVNPITTSKPYLSENLSFFSIDSDNIIITTIKNAEDTDDVIARMYNLKDSKETVNIASYFDIEGYKHTNIIEEDAKPTIPNLEIGKYAIETFSLEIKKE